MTNLNKKALEAAWKAYVDSSMDTAHFAIDAVSAAITAYLAALPKSEQAALACGVTSSEGGAAPVQPPASDPAPVGWRLVPVEPTSEMMRHFAGMPVSTLEMGKAAKEYIAYAAMLAAAPEPPVSDGWRDISSAPSAKPVLVAYKNRCDKWRVVKAVRYEQYQKEQPADDDEGECDEYCEEKDAYFVRAGWYELIDNWDDFRFVSIYEGEPVAWQPLPAPPKGKENE